MKSTDVERLRKSTEDSYRKLAPFRALQAKLDRKRVAIFEVSNHVDSDLLGWYWSRQRLGGDGAHGPYASASEAREHAEQNK